MPSRASNDSRKTKTRGRADEDERLRIRAGEREKDGRYGRDASAFVSCFRSRANPNLSCSLVDHARAFRGWAEASTVDVALVDVVKVDVAASSLRSPDSRFAIRDSRVYEKNPASAHSEITPSAVAVLASLSRLNLSMAASYLRNSSASSSASS